ncbi:hypothetical protein [Phocaeicola dorei]|uniref:hypothetical protein n=1 Tax=Phocaeicola dorei TaxID=357276 RepID=UPI0039B3E6F9
MHWKRLRQSVCHTSECRMSYSPQCPSLLNGWHSQTAERPFGVLGYPLPLFRGRRASPFASYKWQDACTGTGTDYPWLYNLYFRYWLNRPPVPSLKAI